MGDHARVRSPEVLLELRTALARFGLEASSIIEQVSRQIADTNQWIRETHAYWRQEHRDAEDEVASLLSALRQAESWEEEDGIRDRLRAARQHEAKADELLATTERCQRRIADSLTSYRRAEKTLSLQLGERITSATTELGKRVHDLEAYLALASPSGDATGPYATVPGFSTGAIATGLLARWVEHGIVDVPLTEIQDADSTVHGPDDFQKIPYEQVVAGLQKLNDVIRPGVAGGQGPDDFSRLDEEGGVSYEHGYRRIYDAFYGADAIRLERYANAYHVINGYHRLLVAKQLGFESLPARVAERPEATDE